MRVLAIDPGYERCGVAVLAANGNAPELVYSACIETPAEQPFPERLGAIGTAIEQLIAAHTPDRVALETLFFSNNQKTAMHVAEVRGMLVFLAHRHRLPVFEYTPGEIKVAVTSNGAADKKQMMFMLPKLINGIAPDARDDEYDAVAVGLTCLARERA